MAPTAPEAIWTFWLVIAFETSDAFSDRPPQLVGIDPDAKAALCRIERRATHAGDTTNLVDDVADEEVAERDLVHRFIGRDQRDDVEGGGGGLLDQRPLLAHFRRKAGFDALEAVLHLDAGEARIGARLELGRDLDDTERVAGGFEAQDVGRTVELILDEAGGAGIEVLHRRAGIGRRQRDGRWRDDRILGDRQAGDRQNSTQADE